MSRERMPRVQSCHQSKRANEDAGGRRRRRRRRHQRQKQPKLSSGERHDQEENLVVQPGAPVPRANEDAGGRCRRHQRQKQPKPEDQPSSVDNSTGEGGGLEHQLSSGERHDQEENLVVQPGAPVPSVNRANEDAGVQQPCRRCHRRRHRAGRHSYWRRAAVALMHWVVQPLAHWANEALVPLGVQALGRWVTQVMGPWAAEALGPQAAAPAEALGHLATETLRRLVTLALRHLSAEWRQEP